jgi:hypothetical protein
VRRLVATGVVLGVALGGVVTAVRARLAPSKRPVTSTERPRRRPSGTAVPEGHAADAPPGLRRRALDRGPATEVERLRAAWAYVPELDQPPGDGRRAETAR